ncbi:Hypothetical predicted protein [Octopus vulgaris]|uniref:Uncharacterized protein n=1 Tax=Octopus vulgaris TaxID=6645 RepID=A0AA36B9P6_OCTVU|nr:Hypothetical predicted protein [Octopus vulgaris]
MVGARQSLLKRSPLRRRTWTGLSLMRLNRDSSVNITVRHCCTVHVLWARAQSSRLFRFWALYSYLNFSGIRDVENKMYPQCKLDCSKSSLVYPNDIC